MNRIVPLDDLPGVMPRAAKISAGFMQTATKNGKTVTFPAHCRTFVFKCGNPNLLHAAQKIVGGAVSKSPNPRAEGMWRLVSEVTEIEAVLCTDSTRYERWLGDRKLRDCDGQRCRFRIDPTTGQYEQDVPCWCAAHRLSLYDEEACRITTRVNFLIPAFADIPGIGVWQLESRGKTAYQNVKGLHEMLRGMRLPSATGAPVTIRIEIARGHNPKDGSPSAFPIFRIDSKLSIVQTVERAKAFAARVDLKRLPAPDDSTPPLGAGLTPEQEALSNATPIVDPRGRTGSAATQATEGETSAGTPPAAVSVDRDPSLGAERTATASVVSAEGTPHVSSAASPGPTGDDEPEAITDEERPRLTQLINEAAAAEGFRGTGWLRHRFGLKIKKLDDIPRARRAEVRSTAIAILAKQKEPRGNGQDRTTASSAPSARSGNGENAVSPAWRLRELFERDGDDEERQRALIAEFTRGRARRIDQMAPDEIQAMIDTRWPEARASASTP